MSERVAGVTRLGRLLPAWNRQRLFEPALQDLLSERPGRLALWARAVGLYLGCVRITWAERWHLLRSRPSLAHRRLGFGGRGGGSVSGGGDEGPAAGQSNPLESLWQDVRFAWRSLRTRPGFSLMVIVVLALGIGANTTLFTVLDKVVLRPLDFPSPHELVFVTETNRSEGGETPANVTPGSFGEWRERADSFEAMTAILGQGFNLLLDEETRRLTGLVVSGNFFEVLGMPPAVGVPFTPLPERTAREAIISHSLWLQLYAGSAEAIGDELRLDDEPYRVVGVASPDFTFGSDADLWVAADFDVPRPPVGDDQDYLTSFGLGYLGVVGRLRDEVGIDQARDEMSALSDAIGREHPEDQANRGVIVTPLHEYAVGDVRAPLSGLVTAVGFVLLIACVNIASLLLARATTRKRELAIREALGASRTRLFRYLVVESLMLSLAGGAAGVVAAALGSELVAAVLPELPRTIDPSLDGRILLFAVCISVGCGLLFGTAPAWQASRADLRSMLGSTRTSEGRSVQRVRGLLVITEIAVALILVVGAGLMLKNLSRLVSAEPGFEPEGVAVLSLALPENRYDSDGAILGFYQEALDALRALPEVEAAATMLATPFSGSAARMEIFVGTQTEEDAPGQRAVFQTVSPDYFRTMGLPLRAGRDFTAADGADSEPVAIVDEELVRRYFPAGVDPLTVSIHFGELDPVRVVGVVDSVRHFGYAGDIWPGVYVPVRQVPWRFATFAVRARGSVDDLLPRARGVIRDVDPLQAVQRAVPLTDLMRSSVEYPRVATGLVSAFAAAALTLAAIGIFGLISFTVGQRVHEIGIRMALGALRRDVVSLVLRQAAFMLAIGLLLGVLGGVAMSRFIESQLHAVEPTDPVVYAAGALVLAAATLLAAWWPARRAARVDPVRALRTD